MSHDQKGLLLLRFGYGSASKADFRSPVRVALRTHTQSSLESLQQYLQGIRPTALLKFRVEFVKKAPGKKATQNECAGLFLAKQQFSTPIEQLLVNHFS